MIKYKILTNGEKFKVKFKQNFYWEPITEGPCDIELKFDSEEEAEEMVKKLFGKNRRRIRTWRII